jgi:hypothetical protein
VGALEDLELVPGNVGGTGLPGVLDEGDDGEDPPVAAGGGLRAW